MTLFLAVLIFGASAWLTFRPVAPYRSELDRIRATGVGIDAAERERTFTRTVRRVK